jgi:signal transduction histidine kinase
LYGSTVIGRLRRNDVVLAAAVVIAAEVEIAVVDIRPAAAAVPMAVVAGAALALRRRHPVAVAAACVGALVVDTFAGVPQDKPTIPLVWLLLAMYSVALYPKLRPALAGLAAALALFALTLARDTSDLVFGIVIIVAPWLVGRAMRATATEASVHARRAAELEKTREHAVRAAAIEERARIARELHDVISHSVTVMVVQAGAAAEVGRRDPAAAARAMQAVQDVGRQALQELSTLLGVLRADEHEEVGLAPQPRLADLERLVADAEVSGLPVTLNVEGVVRPLTAGVEVSVFRVVQEALTNVRKHSRNASVTVTLRYTDDDVIVEIEDDGIATADSSGGQYGIVGMRERVALLGGEIAAGPAEPRGFRVRARVPLEPT